MEKLTTTTLLMLTVVNAMLLVCNLAITGLAIKLYTDFTKTHVFKTMGGGGI